MNRGAVAEIAALDPAAVFVKGDLSNDGEPHEWAQFEACYGMFGDRLHVVRGNHDAYRGQAGYAGDQWVELPGLSVALLDTVLPGESEGSLTDAQLDWIETMAAAAPGPVLLLGHHPQWLGDGHDGARGEGFVGLHPDASARLCAVADRHPNVIGYSAGHTHRHRHRRMHGATGAASIEVGCVKDFPGTWAEYRVYESGVMQVVHRISSHDALVWSERCRYLYSDFGIDYSSYAMGALDDRCFVIEVQA
jgi:3',5'-cyclic AMP phosphodiesterase CpdA